MNLSHLSGLYIRLWISPYPSFRSPLSFLAISRVRVCWIHALFFFFNSRLEKSFIAAKVSICYPFHSFDRILYWIFVDFLLLSIWFFSPHRQVNFERNFQFFFSVDCSINPLDPKAVLLFLPNFWFSPCSFVFWSKFWIFILECI